MARTSKTLAFVALLLLLGCEAPASAESRKTGTLSGKVAVSHRGKTIKARVVVYLKKVSDAEPRHTPIRRVIQKARKFRPEFLVVTRGTVVEFPNKDIRSHNVYSNSSPNEFDLGEYRPETSKSVRFDDPGVVDVECNIHPEMRSTVLVLDNDYWSLSDLDGTWTIRGVPEGTYELVSWLPYSPRETVEVRVEAGKTTRVGKIVLEEGEAPPRHLRKDGTPYSSSVR